jgi:CRP-like cAMP-binding protein
MSLTDQEVIALLKRVSPFAELPALRLAQLAAAAILRSHPGGALIMQKGDRPVGLFIVATGKIKEACQSPEGDERVIEILGPAQTCGESALLLDCPLPFSVVSLTDTQLLLIDKNTILDLVEREPTFARRMLSALSLRIHILMRDVETFALHAPIQRVASFLIEQSDAHEDTAAIQLPAGKAVVASRLGMTPEALSRAFRDLTEAGMIEVRGHRVAVLDCARLKVLLQ